MVNKIIIAAVTLFLFIGCTSDADRYDKLHKKYRTLWYRTKLDCFYDSSRKYGLLYDESMGYSQPKTGDFFDTVTVNEPTPICK